MYSEVFRVEAGSVVVLINIDKLRGRPRQISINEKATDFLFLRDQSEQKNVVFSEPISGTLEVTRAGQIIEVTGQLSTTIISPCSRCLLPVSGQLEVPVMLSYTDRDDLEEVSFAEEVELQSEDLGLIPFVGTEIDLQPELAQEIITALPQQPLCQKTCLGLCPDCGNNLNRGNCNCETPIFHDGLATLKKFKV